MTWARIALPAAGERGFRRGAHPDPARRPRRSLVGGDRTKDHLGPLAATPKERCDGGLAILGTLCRDTTMREPRMSAQTLKVLGSLLSDPRDELSGADIARLTDLPSGTLYPILLRLEGAKWLSSRW